MRSKPSLKKVLLLTYYWPPAGGGGVQRPLKFCKYLPQFGWEPIVITAENTSAANIDKSLLSDTTGINAVFKAKSIDPAHLFNRYTRKPTPNNAIKKTNSFGNMLYPILNLIRLNFFIPDSKIGWYWPAKRMAEHLTKKQDIKLIFSTSPPYTTHLVAMSLKKITGLNWIADFRDPWVENIAYNTAPRLPIVKKINRHLENRVLCSADAIITVGNGMKKLLNAKLPTEKNKIHVIPNGYDPADTKPALKKAGRFYLSYFGTVYPYPASWKTLLHCLREYIKKDVHFSNVFRLRIWGTISDNVIQLIKDFIPPENLEIRSYQDHALMLEHLYTQQLLLLIIDNIPMNQLIITGKIFEYLPSGNPILALGPTDGDASDILTKFGRQGCIKHDDMNSIKDTIERNFTLWKTGKLPATPKRIPSLERQELTNRLASIFDALVKIQKR